MFDGVIDGLRAWLESIRAWVLGQDALAWAHGWIREAPVSAIWIFVVFLVVVVVLLIGFWPPLKPLEDEDPERREGE